MPVAGERISGRTDSPPVRGAQPALPGAFGAPVPPSYARRPGIGASTARAAASAGRTAVAAAWQGAQRESGGKAAWYAVNLAVDAVGAGVPTALALHASGAPHAAAWGLAAALAWPTVRAMRRRYAPDAFGETRGGAQVAVDWLLLLGVLTVLRAVSGAVAGPSAALAGLVWAPVLTALCRRVTYHRLRAVRRAAYAVRPVLVVGEPGAADNAVAHLATRTGHAYAVVGVVPVGSRRLACGVPVAGRLGVLEPTGPGQDAQAVLRAAHETRAQLVLMAPGPRLSAERLRRLSWCLHDAGLPVALAPGLVDVQARRVRLDDPAGLVLLHIAPPVRHGAQLRLKSALDRAGAALGLLALAPLFCVLAALVKVTSRGPAFYRQVRCGQHRTPFTMWKFRTMVVDAEDRRAELERSGANEHDGLMFKMRHDPRVTAVGRFLRRCSLDELPQLLNVLRGEMSFVGPRPPLPDEVDRYDEVALRRLVVKPGITGLWQVSGRSDLSWDETLALDLRYVDNWSLAGDLEVMTRTLRAVVDGRGAY
ncbi:sugar transferase [Streptomyces sp. NRRL F-5123]|uniref:sugar transferase n=1 Tax=Streptomyces sp. NRRL F-5123 TaxID=1463856 RepID=UPI00099D9528|nr:sugar transferase [Streptomyces sp. NRRL F-5123]